MDDTNNKQDAVDKFEYLFEAFWQDLEEYAKEMDLPTWYVEEEFVIDGELIKQEPRNMN